MIIKQLREGAFRDRQEKINSVYNMWLAFAR